MIGKVCVQAHGATLDADDAVSMHVRPFHWTQP
ncbi:hypothetical protein DFR41_104187 [Pseudacidovorax intermedius]|uniref:Uncharacterized protein n=1 Tax=Pseudacidovorax intermedius TaxID=433924 RepID=A0A370FI87_9BURK|nr:hypothetical protein DFR41_104187 [Pseudacidovorax intermedius]